MDVLESHINPANSSLVSLLKISEFYLIYIQSNNYNFSLKTGECIRCYGCYSQSSADDCWLNSVTYNCESGSVCYTAKHKMYGIDLHYKGCLQESNCNSYKVCGALPTDRNCKVSLILVFTNFHMNSEGFILW